ncbi:hypothetical protein NMG60_11028424 [Bertholletia excelsa]
MEGGLRDGWFITMPLLRGIKDEKHNRRGDEESSISHEAGSGTATYLKTCFNGLNALSGIGILSVPYALSSGGWLSIIFLFAIAAATFYTGLLIKKCMDLDLSIKSYPDIGALAFGNRGRLVVSIFMNVELYLVATAFLILEGDNLDKLFPIGGIEICGLRFEAKQVFIIVVGVVILPTVLLEDLSVLSYVSATGVVASFVILGSIFWAGAFGGVGFKERGELLDFKGVPTSISMYAFCYCAHPVFPTLYSSMRNQKQFSNVLLVCFVVCTITYASIAVLGYMMFGSKIESQITLNLPTENISSEVAIYTILVTPIAKFALTVTPIVNFIENGLPRSSNRRPASLLVRIALLVSSVVVALALPFFGSLVSLVGAFLSTTASILLPCVCYLKISGACRRFGVEVVVIWGILLVGVGIMVIGTYTSVVEIIGHL